MTTPNETLFKLSDGRTLAYADIGNTQSSLVVVFYHGVAGVGTAKRLSHSLKARGVHYIAPTLAGWGNSSRRPKSMSYCAALLSDFTELINHLHPDDPNLRIYIAGGSFGTVPAQIVYGAPFDMFPLGRHVVGCFIAAPFSPFKWHKGYEKAMTWPNYISVGPPAHNLPLIPTMLASLIRYKLSSVDEAEKFIRATLFDKALPEEREAFANYREENGIADGELERDMATGSFNSMRNSTEGFKDAALALHGDWGFRPHMLDEEHTARKMLIVASKCDDLGPDMAEWLAANYKGSTLRWTGGGHISALYEIDTFWKELLGNDGMSDLTSTWD